MRTSKVRSPTVTAVIVMSPLGGVSAPASGSGVSIGVSGLEASDIGSVGDAHDTASTVARLRMTNDDLCMCRYLLG